MIKFFHFQPENLLYGESFTHKGVTFCYTYDKEKGLLTFSLSQCNKGDQYNKQVGRETSLKHWKDGNALTMYYRTNKHKPLCSFFTSFGNTLCNSY